ncbi:hypothetical protein K488DRAFT_85870 [Vararia minispora EC-137]|uniref:Uncharacterized protein n=1 Tax=Vararia minispora EC-137 TaxID=1314806 RepID=A0ACB8QLI5_9AGAM|nr:hypothetical protein K488DRAFT_85870 [Vararia minispora EC-137]
MSTLPETVVSGASLLALWLALSVSTAGEPGDIDDMRSYAGVNLAPSNAVLRSTVQYSSPPLPFSLTGNALAARETRKYTPVAFGWAFMDMLTQT